MTTTQILDIAYIRLGASDLDATSEFLNKFGLTTQRYDTTLYGRGTNGNPYCLISEAGSPGLKAVGFEVASRDDLERLSSLDDGSGITAVDAPGGGELVRFTDPNGYTVEAIYGWQRDSAVPPDARPPVNSGELRTRIQKPVRLEPLPSRVKRLGHCVLHVKDFRESEAWYKSRFGFLTSDEIHTDSPERAMGAFMRCNRGETPVDHHTLFLLQTPGEGLQHAAFEVHDWDDLMVGHDVLTQAGYQHQWGIGKHVLGSQVFDYWRDPDGHTLEHFTDGDLFDASYPPGSASLESIRRVQWGAQMPAAQ